jgi:hypothetical protein
MGIHKNTGKKVAIKSIAKGLFVYVCVCVCLFVCLLLATVQIITVFNFFQTKQTQK